MKIPKRKEKKLKNTRNENIAIINFAIKMGAICHHFNGNTVTFSLNGIVWQLDTADIDYNSCNYGEAEWSANYIERNQVINWNEVIKALSSV